MPALISGKITAFKTVIPTINNIVFFSRLVIAPHSLKINQIINAAIATNPRHINIVKSINAITSISLILLSQLKWDVMVFVKFLTLFFVLFDMKIMAYY
jgi:hypothetical protein